MQSTEKKLQLKPTHSVTCTESRPVTLPPALLCLLYDGNRVSVQAVSSVALALTTQHH